MKQLGLGEGLFPAKKAKQTRREVFLAEMEQVVPWSRLEGLIEPHYPKRGNGRQPIGLPVMLRIHFMQQWFGYSDLGMEEALHEVAILRRFAGLDRVVDVIPDESTILRFRHILEAHKLSEAVFAEVGNLLKEKGLLLREGSLVDATLIAAPSSTKNKEKKRDPAMTQTRKGQQWYFGMKAHIGVDAQSGLIHTMECTTASVSDTAKLKDCLHGEEKLVLADRGYHKANRTIEQFEREEGKMILTPSKKPKGGKLTEEQKAFNRDISKLRAYVEHPFRVLKCQFGFRKVRYRGLEKNTHQLRTLFALVNLWLARKRLIPLVGEVCP